MIMKTSPKTTVALLAILALGGSTAGSLFSESLQTNVIGTIGSAGAFFPDQVIQMPAQQATFTTNKSKPDVVVDVVALPIDAMTLTPVPAIEIQVRAITSPEIVVTPSPSAVPTPQDRCRSLQSRDICTPTASRTRQSARDHPYLASFAPLIAAALGQQ